MVNVRMDAERWKRVEDLLQAVLELPADQQEEFLRQACAGDKVLLEEVRSLLTSHRKVGSFLEPPMINVAAHAAVIGATPPPRPSHHGPDRLSLSRARSHWAAAAWASFTKPKILCSAGWRR